MLLLQGVAMQSILHAMVEQGGPLAIDFDFVLVVGHFLTRDENIFTFFEVGHPAGKTSTPQKELELCSSPAGGTFCRATKASSPFLR